MSQDDKDRQLAEKAERLAREVAAMKIERERQRVEQANQQRDPIQPISSLFEQVKGISKPSESPTRSS